jgi:pimeloyl-ACP methyl ester carboxylesterase
VHATTYKSIDVNRLSIFYSEAGSPDAPALLLLHGFPSSSRMYEPLFTRLADAFHMVAPDYPGFGHSDAPGPAVFDYTFDNLYRTIERFTELMRIDRYSLFLQDHGSPIGFRMALARPDRLAALVIQNAALTTMGWGHFGRPVVISGLIAPATKVLSGRTFCPWMPRASGTWEPPRTYPCTTQTSGPTSSRS